MTTITATMTTTTAAAAATMMTVTTVTMTMISSVLLHDQQLLLIAIESGACQDVRAACHRHGRAGDVVRLRCFWTRKPAAAMGARDTRMVACHTGRANTRKTGAHAPRID